MTAPEKLWLLWREGGHVKCRVVASEMDHSDEGFPEYIRADLLEAHIGAVLDDWKSRIENLWITADNDREEGYDEGLGAALEELSFVRPDALQALERVRREARVEGMRETVTLYAQQPSNAWDWVPSFSVEKTHRITFDLLYGEPDCASIKMEKL